MFDGVTGIFGALEDMSIVKLGGARIVYPNEGDIIAGA
jgi:hypothetical protein